MARQLVALSSVPAGATSPAGAGHRAGRDRPRRRWRTCPRHGFVPGTDAQVSSARAPTAPSPWSWVRTASPSAPPWPTSCSCPPAGSRPPGRRPASVATACPEGWASGCGGGLGGASGRRPSSMIRRAISRIVHPFPHGRLLDPGEGVDSFMPCSSMSRPLARSTSRRVSSCSSRLLTSWAEGLHLLEAAQGDLDGRQQLALLERLDQIGQGPGVARLVDQVALAEGGEDEHGGQSLADDGLAPPSARPCRAS